MANFHSNILESIILMFTDDATGGGGQVPPPLLFTAMSEAVRSSLFFQYDIIDKIKSLKCI
jgi:hypothetical protein